MNRNGQELARARYASPIFCALALAMLAGCVAPQQNQSALEARIEALQISLDQLQLQLAATQMALSDNQAQHTDSDQQLSEQVQSLQQRLEQLPQTVAAMVPAEGAKTASKPSPQALPANAPPAPERLVVGEVERVWIDPPKALIVARIDPNAANSSLHAENLVKFERDGDDWVRFDLMLDKKDQQPVTIEREIRRYVRLPQADGSEGSRHPVVTLRVRIGAARETVEFVLGDRPSPDFEMQLGRNFLTDVALVDVGKRFVQPPYNPKTRN
ncbi:MAG: RimK/LysX family protein [Pseudomonadales bacterium]